MYTPYRARFEGKMRKFLIKYDTFRYKKTLMVLVLILLITIFSVSISHISASNDEESNYDEELWGAVQDQLNSLNLTDIEALFKDFTTRQSDFFGAESFTEKVQRLINGEYSDTANSAFQSLLYMIFDDLLDILPMISAIVAMAILCGLLGQFRSATTGDKSVGEVIHFVCYGVVIALVLTSVLGLVRMTSATLSLQKTQIETVFPILLTIMVAMGNVTSVGVYQPAVALFSGGIMQLFTNLLMPIFLFTFAFSVVSNLSSSVKLEKFTSFFSSLFKWTVGIIFTVFLAFLGIQGITAASFDGVSIRTARYAMRSYIPILGGYLSEGFDLILTSSVLTKNAIGAGGLMLMLATVIVPVIKIALFSLALKLTAAVLEPVADSRISNFLTSVSKAMTMLIVLLVGVAFLYLISVGLIMCTGNAF